MGGGRMTAIIHNLKPDDILTFLPGISDEEYAHRAKLRSLRNTAAAMIAESRSADARTLAWVCSDRVTEFIYAPAPLWLLDKVAKLCTRTIVVASDTHGFDYGASA